MILDDIKQFLTENNLVQDAVVKYDYASDGENDIVLLKLYDNLPCDVARRSSVEITYIYADLCKAREFAFAVHDLFFPQDNFQKAIRVNGKLMHVKLNKGPCYQGKDSSKRHNYVLDITLTYER